MELRKRISEMLGSKRYLRETMQVRRRFVLRLVAGAATLVSAFPVARSGMAQVWPTRPLTMVVPYAAGGPVDTIGRVTAAGLSQVLGQQVVIGRASCRERVCNDV